MKYLLTFILASTLIITGSVRVHAEDGSGDSNENEGGESAMTLPPSMPPKPIMGTNFFGDIRQKIDDSKNEIREHEEEIRGEIEQNRGKIQMLRNNLGEKSDEIRQKMEERRGEMMGKLAEKMAERFSAMTERMDKLIGRMQSRIDKIKATGKDTSVAQTHLDEARTALINTQATASSIILSDNTDKATTDANKISIDKVKSEMKEVQTHLQEAMKALRLLRPSTTPTVPPAPTTTENTGENN